MYTIIMQFKNIGYHAHLKEKEHLFRYRAWLEGNFFRCVCVRARAHLRALMTRKSCAVAGLEKTPVRSSGTSRFSLRASNFLSFLARRARTGKDPGKAFAD